jgi:hypothetical protein
VKKGIETERVREMPQKKKKKGSTSSGRDAISSSSTSSLTTSEHVLHDQQDESESPRLSQTPNKEDQPPAKNSQYSAVPEELDQLLAGLGAMTRSDCVAGIKKADEAVAGCAKEQEDEEETLDLRCLLQLRRAKLLKIVFDKRYGTLGLTSQHSKPLESCMYDCQQGMFHSPLLDTPRSGLFLDFICMDPSYPYIRLFRQATGELHVRLPTGYVPFTTT